MLPSAIAVLPSLVTKKGPLSSPTHHDSSTPRPSSSRCCFLPTFFSFPSTSCAQLIPVLFSIPLHLHNWLLSLSPCEKAFPLSRRRRLLNMDGSRKRRRRRRVTVPVLLRFLFCLDISCSTGTFVGFSYDARSGGVPANGEPREALLRLLKNSAWNSQHNFFLASPGKMADSLRTSGVPVYLFLKPSEARRYLKWRNLDVRQVVVTGGGEVSLSTLLSSMRYLHRSLKAAGLSRIVQISVSLPLRSIQKARKKELRKVLKFVKDNGNFVLIEIAVDGQLSLADRFVQSVRRRTVAALQFVDIPVLVNVKSSVIPTAAEIALFLIAVKKVLREDGVSERRVFGILVDVSHAYLARSEKEKMTWQEEVIFMPSRRGLADMARDIYVPVTNPATMTPITVPSTIPSPDVLTVPSTTPVTVLPTTPGANPGMMPLYPVTAPITVPATNPVQTMPGTTTPGFGYYPPTPTTNPVTTPTTVPYTVPVTNPVTTYPYPQGGGVPTVTTPGAVPSTVPAVSGQTWCVAKTGLPDITLQNALDYACGIGGADCSAIQPLGSCYNPNSLQAHASFAFNSYYQRNPTPTSCDFGGAGMVVNINPSSGTCQFPASSPSTSVYSPTAGTTGPLNSYTPVTNPISGPPAAYGSSSGSGAGYSSATSGSATLNSNNSGSSNGLESTSTTSLARRTVPWVSFLLVLMFAGVTAPV